MDKIFKVSIRVAGSVSISRIVTLKDLGSNPDDWENASEFQRKAMLRAAALKDVTWSYVEHGGFPKEFPA